MIQSKPCTVEGCAYPRFAKKLCKKHHNIQFPPKPLQRTPIKPSKSKIKPVSDTQKQRTNKYLQKRKEWLKQYPKCQVEGCTRLATQIHHKSGRIGNNLYKNFLSVCTEHHHMIEENPAWAKEQGYSLSRLN